MGGFISNRAGKKGRIFNFAEKNICYGVVSKNAVATNGKSVGFFVLDLRILKEAAAESSVFHIRRGSDVSLDLPSWIFSPHYINFFQALCGHR